ncbi:MAG: integrase catalytic domain-containing protein, partial [Bacteroidales bacterium]|nr:integrase catalytic domain-containing protein [Bacteroidales bacterium]
IYPERETKSNFFSIWEEFLNSKQDMTKGGKKPLEVCRDNLIRFERYYQVFKDKNFVLSFSSVSDTIVQQFYDFIINECHYIDHPAMKEFYETIDKRQRREERHINTANARVKKFRTFWIWAVKRGYTENDPFKTYTVPTDRYATPIFLLPEEVKRIYNLDLSNNEYLDKARDIFIFQCMIGCRREDLWSLTKDNIQEGVLSYIPQKTIKKQQKTLRVPLNSIALEILDKYKNENYLLPTHICINYYNRAIKQIATLSMLDRKVTIFNTKGQPEIKEIKDVISSHIARKTFISVLINNGVAPQVISSMSGHVPNSKAFERYFNIEDEIKKSVVKNLEI